MIPRPCTIRDEFAQKMSDMSFPSVRVIQSPESNVGRIVSAKSYPLNLVLLPKEATDLYQVSCTTSRVCVQATVISYVSRSTTASHLDCEAKYPKLSCARVASGAAAWTKVGEPERTLRVFNEIQLQQHQKSSTNFERYHRYPDTRHFVQQSRCPPLLRPS